MTDRPDAPWWRFRFDAGLVGLAYVIASAWIVAAEIVAGSLYLLWRMFR